MKVVFAGTPIFAAVALEQLLQSSHTVLAVYTQPDRKAGRGLKWVTSPVKELALKHHLPVLQPVSLLDSAQEQLSQFNADVLVVTAYGLLLPAAVLSIPPFGCINIHPSLLPRWRGAAPIQRSLYAGDAITGVTIMQMDQGLDTGPILLQRQYVMEPDETAQTLQNRLAKLGAEALIETLDLLSQNKIKKRPQDNSQATYAHKICKEEALLDWTRPALELENEIRAFNPWPVAYTSWHGKDLRIWKAKAIDHEHQSIPRTIIRATHQGIDIATGKGILRLLELQLPGGKILTVTEFFNARHKDLVAGEHFL